MGRHCTPLLPPACLCHVSNTVCCGKTVPLPPAGLCPPHEAWERDLSIWEVHTLARPSLTCSQTILWYTSCLMLISTSNSDSFLSASVLAVRMSLEGETCWGKSRMFL